MPTAPLELIRQILVEQCDCSPPIQETSRLVEDLHLESLALLTLVTELENHYQTAFDLHASSQFQTIGDIVHYIHTQTQMHHA